MQHSATSGIRIRPASLADADPIARVHIDAWRSAYAGILSAEYLASLTHEDSESMWATILSKAHLVFVAEDGDGRVVAFASGGPTRQADTATRAEIYAIYVLEEIQGKGVGQRLVSALTRQLQETGFTSLLAWVLEGNHAARRFYESLGGEQVDCRLNTIGETDVVEVSYEWKVITNPAVPPVT